MTMALATIHSCTKEHTSNVTFDTEALWVKQLCNSFPMFVCCSRCCCCLVPLMKNIWIFTLLQRFLWLFQMSLSTDCSPLKMHNVIGFLLHKTQFSEHFMLDFCINKPNNKRWKALHVPHSNGLFYVRGILNAIIRVQTFSFSFCQEPFSRGLFSEKLKEYVQQRFFSSKFPLLIIN